MHVRTRTRTRREFVRDAFCGFGGLALASLLAPGTGCGPARPIRSPPSRRICRAKAKAVIFLFMAGGPSHLETFDPKPLLNKLARPAAAGGVRRGEVSVRPARRQAARHAAHVPEVRPERHRGLRPVPAHGQLRRRHRRRPLVPRRHGRPLGRAVRAVHRPGRAGLSQHGLVGPLRPGLGERVAAGLRRACPIPRARWKPASRCTCTAFCRPSISRRCSAPASGRCATSTCPRGVDRSSSGARRSS